MVGLALCLFGYQRTQPTLADTAVGLIEQLSSAEAPQDLKSDKSQGYLLLGVGAVSFFTGLGMIIHSRTDSQMPKSCGEFTDKGIGAER